ncbi:glycosyl hydrolase family 61-domain-containing protein [Collybia nuda]|uniref:AA9 family lytic polysaccharide monooxygenase n=1 Tax=Collybia nuda TaxID=64659 RepID=A0A9P6CPY4_9AGAR|nr:glycosyl hydrolase family 61-domain-containing protein [Collybia nuda]
MKLSIICRLFFYWAVVKLAHARTVFSGVSVNGVDQGHAVGVRVPSTNAPITDITSPNIICNTDYIQPVSKTIINVPAGGQVTAQFHHTSAGYIGKDPADPLDPTNKGPVIAYLAAVPSATQTTVTGLKWFKIFESGYNLTTHQWGSDVLFINKGNATFTIPSCIKPGQYLLRAESIALQSASSYPGAQFYMSCAQLSITGSGSTNPATVSFPGAYEPTDPGIVVQSIFNVIEYAPPGPSVFSC